MSWCHLHLELPKSKLFLLALLSLSWLSTRQALLAACSPKEPLASAEVLALILSVAASDVLLLLGRLQGQAGLRLHVDTYNIYIYIIWAEE